MRPCWPSGHADPSARPCVIPGLWSHPVHQIGTIVRIIHHTAINALQPLVPPAKGFLKKADARLGDGEVRIFVDPRAGQTPHRRRNVFYKGGHSVFVGITPTADCQHCSGDGVVILADGPVLPVAVAILVCQPAYWQKRFCLEPVQPHFPPRIADKRRIGRARGVGPHG